MAEIDRALLPIERRRQLPAGNQPVIKLARLAVDQAFQGQGLGGVLLFEAMQRAASAQTLTGAVALAVEAKHPQAAAFYARFGFLPAPHNELALFMGFAPIRELIRAMQTPQGADRA